VKKTSKIISEIVTWLLVILIVLMSISLISMKITGGPPTILGHRMFIVLSGSMEPTIKTGSVVFVKPVESGSLAAGDVITFRGFGDPNNLVTHRIVSIEGEAAGTAYITKGDANEVEDPSPVAANRVVGKVNFTIPYLGYFLYISQTEKGGKILLALIGAILLIYGGASIYDHVKTGKKTNAGEEQNT